ncbi:MAG TPA: M64 family metallopeptidase [Vicinamibacterales bacterium]|jgi:hypothetical protein|nr:M64 family metallopeptidase [Vicinamibacterales bacterium]
MTLAKRLIHWLAGALLAVAGVQADAFAQTITPIFPTSGPGGSYVIAVVSDGYANTSSDRQKFDNAVNGLIVNGMLLDPFYQAHEAAFTIVKVFQPSPQSGQSQFGITQNYDVTHCYINWIPDSSTPNTATMIDNAVQSVGPDRTLVVGNNESQAFGCTPHDGDWTYVTAWARTEEPGGILEHEFGHLIAGLWDEYAFTNPPYTGSYPTPPPVTGPNCSTEASPSWLTLPVAGAGKIQSCKFYQLNIFRPYSTCRMKDTTFAFCPVCAYSVDHQLSAFLNGSEPQAPTDVRTIKARFVVQPTPPSPQNNQTVRVLVEINPQTAGARVLTVSDITRRDVNRRHRVGDYVYEVIDGGQTIAIGVLPGDPFEDRAYGARGAPHDTQRTSTASAVIFIPHVSRQNLLTRAVEINFYRLDPSSGRDDVTPERLAGFRQTGLARPVAKVTADELKKAISAPRK